MPDVTSVRRPRRWWRVARAVLLLLTVVLFVAWWFAPMLAVWVLHDRLPWTISFSNGSVTVRQAAVAPLANVKPEAQIVGSPATLQSIATAASGWWLPPRLLHGGVNAVGDLSLPVLRPEPFRWQVLAAGAEATPLTCLRVSHVDLTEFLRLNGQSVVSVGGTPIMRCLYRVDGGRITDDDEPGQYPLVRRQRVVAHGAILLLAGQAQRTLRVDRLAGHAFTTFVPVPEGYRVQMRVAIEESDAELITLPIIGDVRPILLKQLEKAANDGLEGGMERVVLPPWFPIGMRTDVTVE